MVNICRYKSSEVATQISGVDFSKEEDIQQIQTLVPLLSGGGNTWHGIHFHHQRVLAGEIGECYSLQHVVVIHLDSFEEDRWFDRRFRHERLTVGESFICPQQVTYKSCLLGDGVEQILIGIEPEFLTETALKTFDRSIKLTPQFSHSNPLILQIGLELKADLAAGCPGGLLYGESLATVLVMYLLKQYGTHQLKIREYGKGLSQPQLQRAIDYIHAHLDQDIKLADLAEVLGMSQYYFCRLFSQAIGMAPYRYVLQQRVERAKQLLKQKEVTISDIALQCGFTDHSHLTRIFRQLTGITPKAYRGQ